MLVYLDTLIGFSVVMLGISLLIVIVNQIVSALFAHRGANLRWGLRTLFADISPTALPALAAQADAIADRVLIHPFVSDSIFSKYHTDNRFVKRWKLASAIRSDELVSVLSHLSTVGPLAGTAVSADIQALLNASNPTASRQVGIISAASAAVGIAPAAAVPLLGATFNTIRESAGNLDAWFDAMMSRVAQRFAMQMRIWTLVFAALFAFATGLDSIQLLNQLYRNDDLRDKLSSAATDMLTTAGSILPNGSTSDKDAVTRVMTGTVTSALQKSLTDAGVSAPTPIGITSEDAGNDWIMANVAKQEDKMKVKNAFHSNVATATRALIELRAKDAAHVQLVLSTSGLNILQSQWDRKRILQQLVGVFVTIGLLSLGAPFWFNTLKSLSNLRPVVANNQRNAPQRQS